MFPRFTLFKDICAKYGLILSAKHGKKWKDGINKTIALKYIINNDINTMNIVNLLSRKLKLSIDVQTKLIKYNKYKSDKIKTFNILKINK